MTYVSFSPDESAFTRNTLTKDALNFLGALVIVVVTLISVGTSRALAAGDDTGLGNPTGGHQARWNRDNPESGMHDGQPRPDANCASSPVLHESRPAPDRTQQRTYRFSIPAERQRRRNNAGGAAGNGGYQNIRNREDPRYQPVPAGNALHAAAATLGVDMFQQIGGAPQQQLPSAIADMQGQAQGAGDAAQNASLNALDEYIPMIIAGNINVANEATGTSGSTRAPFRPVSQAIGMVQQMYRRVYLPMALLLLLPGAVILQMKNMISQFAMQDDDASGGPFSHILRGMIALFLIPSTQLIMSYSIDVGNSMTYVVAQQFSALEIVQWARAQQTAKEAQGRPVNRLDPQPFKDQTMQMCAGMINMSVGYGLLILAAMQLALSCYLLLMGPIAAALYAWPGSVGRLFKPVFINWVNAVVTLSLWRFWWILIVFVMVTRIQWLREIGEYVPNTEWEALMLGCFMVMMMYVPFAPFELKPGELVDKLLEKAKEISASGSAGGKQGGPA
ncbi:MAG: hypothetical protein IAF58_19215 [Leptolyngbya sp.]|nr:hypothetical protein [Candidatus Melainabacteria bacterium]